MNFAWVWPLIGAAIGAVFGAAAGTYFGERVWNRQKRWELKREVLFEATKRLAEVTDALVGVYAMVDAPEMEEIVKSQIHDKWNHAELGLVETVLLVGTVCEKETSQAFSKFADITLTIANSTYNQKDTSAFLASREAIQKSQYAAMAAVRKELGIDA